MQKTIWTYLLICCTLALAIGCENEVNVAADWEETAIVYAALNPTDSVNYVRIQHTYLDQKESAFAFVDEQDSLYYDKLEVYIDEYREGIFSKRIDLVKVDGNDEGLPKDSGLFYSGTNTLYKISDPILASSFTVDYTYTLHVENPRTGYTCNATTISMGNPNVLKPLSGEFGFVQPNVAEGHSIYINFQEGKNVRSYTIDMDMRIEEFEINNPSNSVIKDVQWRMVNSGKTMSLTNLEKATYLTPSVNFFAAIAAALPVDPTLGRRLVDFDMSYYGLSEELNTYLNVSKPSISIIQKKPEYTNVENGLGIFTSRNVWRFQNRAFHVNTLTQLTLSEYTRDLGFVE